MHETVGDRLGVKAAGGIRTLGHVVSMIKAGASRIGTSAGVAIMDDARTLPDGDDKNRVLELGNERFWRLAQAPCAVNRFTLQNGVFTLESLNDTSHIEGLS